MSELSEERSDADSEEFPGCENEEPHITIPIGNDLNRDTVEEETESEGDESDVDEILVAMKVVNDLEKELKEDEGLNLMDVDNLTFEEPANVERGNHSMCIPVFTKHNIPTNTMTVAYSSSRSISNTVKTNQLPSTTDTTTPTNQPPPTPTP